MKMYESVKPKPTLTCKPQISSAHWHTRSFTSPSGSKAPWPTSLCWHLPQLLGHTWVPGCPGHGHTSLPNHGREREGRAGWGPIRGSYLHEEGHQLDEGLFLGAGGKLGDHLDDLVHDVAQVVLELLPSFLHELGILRRQTGGASRMLSSPIRKCPPEHAMDASPPPGPLTFTRRLPCA